MAVKIINADVMDGLRQLPDESVHCCVTSPPYWGLRDYGVPGQIGLEPTPDAFVARLVEVFREVRRVLRKDGTCWVNLGDSYAAGGLGAGSGKQLTNVGSNMPARRAPDGLKAKDLVGIPWRVAFALQADGWYLRSDIIWAKPNPMPESVTDRPTKAHEYIFLLTKAERYFYDAEAIKESASDTPGAAAWRKTFDPSKQTKEAALMASGVKGGNDGDASARYGVSRNKRTVWEVATAPFAEAHFATFPPALIEPMIKAGCPVGGTVLDPFGGAGTTGLVSDRLQRSAVLIELNPEYAAIAEKRIYSDAGGLFAAVGVDAPKPATPHAQQSLLSALETTP